MSTGASFFKDSNAHISYAYKSLNSRIDSHRARKIHNHCESVRRTVSAWKGFTESFCSLLDAAESSSSSLAMTLTSFNGSTDRDEFVSVLDQCAIAYLAGVGAVIEQSRDIDKNYLSTESSAEYAQMTAQLRQELPYAETLSKFRNYALHNLALPWVFNGSIMSGSDGSGKVLLETEPILNSKALNAPAKEYLRSQGSRVRIRPWITPHFERTATNIQWLLDRARDDNKSDFDEVNSLIREQTRLMTGGATDDAKEWQAHVARNLKRSKRGEAQQDFDGNEVPDV